MCRILKYWWSPLEALYASFISHNSAKIRCENKFVFKYEESPLDDVIGGMGGVNFTPT